MARRSLKRMWSTAFTARCHPRSPRSMVFLSPTWASSKTPPPRWERPGTLLSAGGVQSSDFAGCKAQLRRGGKILELVNAGGAGNRRGDRRPRDEPGKRHGGRIHSMSGGDFIQRGQYLLSLRVQIIGHAAAALALPEIGGRTVFAGEKAAGQPVIGNDADVFLEAELLQRAFEIGAVVKVEPRLQTFVARQAVRGGGIERLFQARRGEIGGAQAANLPLSHQLGIAFQRLLHGNRIVVAMRLVKINSLDLQPFQRFLNFRFDVAAREPLLVRPHLVAHLGKDQDALAPPAAL